MTLMTLLLPEDEKCELCEYCNIPPCLIQCFKGGWAKGAVIPQEIFHVVVEFIKYILDYVAPSQPIYSIVEAVRIAI